MELMEHQVPTVLLEQMEHQGLVVHQAQTVRQV
jgi:hypothetical protein